MRQCLIRARLVGWSNNNNTISYTSSSSNSTQLPTVDVRVLVGDFKFRISHHFNLLSDPAETIAKCPSNSAPDTAPAESTLGLEPYSCPPQSTACASLTRAVHRLPALNRRSNNEKAPHFPPERSKLGDSMLWSMHETDWRQIPGAPAGAGFSVSSGAKAFECRPRISRTAFRKTSPDLEPQARVCPPSNQCIAVISEQRSSPSEKHHRSLPRVCLEMWATP